MLSNRHWIRPVIVNNLVGVNDACISGVKVNIHNPQNIGRYGKFGMCKWKKGSCISPLIETGVIAR